MRVSCVKSIIIYFGKQMIAGGLVVRRCLGPETLEGFTELLQFMLAHFISCGFFLSHLLIVTIRLLLGELCFHPCSSVMVE
jgi:hypothetical protein